MSMSVAGVHTRQGKQPQHNTGAFSSSVSKQIAQTPSLHRLSGPKDMQGWGRAVLTQGGATDEFDAGGCVARRSGSTNDSGPSPVPTRAGEEASAGAAAVHPSRRGSCSLPFAPHIPRLVGSGMATQLSNLM